MSDGECPPPEVDGMIERQIVSGTETVNLKVRGHRDDSLDDVLERWIRLKDDLLKDLEGLNGRT